MKKILMIVVIGALMTGCMGNNLGMSNISLETKSNVNIPTDTTTVSAVSVSVVKDTSDTTTEALPGEMDIILLSIRISNPTDKLLYGKVKFQKKDDSGIIKDFSICNSEEILSTTETAENRVPPGTSLIEVLVDISQTAKTGDKISVNLIEFSVVDENGISVNVTGNMPIEGTITNINENKLIVNKFITNNRLFNGENVLINFAIINPGTEDIWVKRIGIDTISNVEFSNPILKCEGIAISQLNQMTGTGGDVNIKIKGGQSIPFSVITFVTGVREGSSINTKVTSVYGEDGEGDAVILLGIPTTSMNIIY